MSFWTDMQKVASFESMKLKSTGQGSQVVGVPAFHMGGWGSISCYFEKNFISREGPYFCRLMHH